MTSNDETRNHVDCSNSLNMMLILYNYKLIKVTTKRVIILRDCQFLQEVNTKTGY